MRTLDCLNDKQVAIIGLGITGLSCIRYLQKQQSRLNVRLCAMDSRAALALPESVIDNIPVTLGRFDTQMLAKSDVWVVSPGVSLSTPELLEARQENTIILGDVELFALFLNAMNPTLFAPVKVAAVTGSNGKSTVVTLMHNMAQKAGVEVALAGNIGTPVLDVLDELDALAYSESSKTVVQKKHKTALVILELSSFQLETTQSLLPDIACIMNISEDHMDRYPDFAAYCEAKQRIYANAACAVYWQEDEHTHPTASALNDLKTLSLSSQPQKVGFGMAQSAVSNEKSITLNGEPYLHASELSVLGEHNLLNVQAAAVMMRELGVSDEMIVLAAKQFCGLPHRCQHVAKKRGAIWINDSKATNVGATLAAISGIRDAIAGKLILIAGGDSKGADLSPLQSAFRRDVNEVILFGKDAPLIKALCANAHEVPDLNCAVALAAELNKKRVGEDNVVLLSPACASLDMFTNYQQRGEQFTQAVEALHS